MVAAQTFWTIQQVAAFTVTAAAAAAIVWRVARKIVHSIEANHAKIDALEGLISSGDGPITTGALAALHRMERRLLLTSAQVRLVMDSRGVGYIETDAEGMLTYANAQWVVWTDIPIEQARGRGWLSGIYLEDRVRLRQEWGESVRDQRAAEFRFRYVDASGRLTPVIARSTVVRQEQNGEVLGFVALIEEDRDA